MNAFAVVTRGLRDALCGADAAEGTLECVDATLAKLRSRGHQGWAVRLVPHGTRDCDVYGLARDCDGAPLLLEAPLDQDLPSALGRLNMQEVFRPPGLDLRVVGIRFLMCDDREEALCG